MPDKTLEQLLDPDVLTERYVQLAGGRSFPLTEQFFINPRPSRSSEFSFLFYPALGEPAPVNVRGGTARSLTPGEALKRYASCYHMFNRMPVDGDALTALRHPDNPELQQRGADSVSRVFDEFNVRHKVTKELIIAKSLSAGVVYTNALGQVLESSSGATATCDLGVPAGHKGNLGGLVSALWSTDSTSIATQLDNIVRAAGQANVERPTDIWTNAINKIHLRSNDEFAAWATHSYRAVDAVLRGDVIEDLWGFNWHFLSGTYRDAAGATQDFLPTDIAVITPPPAGNWLRTTNGLTLVPRSIGLLPDWQSALNGLDEKFGPYSYAEVTHNPAMMSLYMGDLFGFHFADPSAVWIATAFTETA